jgi:ABC-type bacteriocin/lantibiotic exporter with double-glycine peptidase domain
VLLKQSTLLFLDEATAALDTETEALFQNVLETNFSNSTIVCIAHRTEALKWCKTRIEMRQGKILRVSDVDVVSK